MLLKIDRLQISPLNNDYTSTKVPSKTFQVSTFLAKPNHNYLKASKTLNNSNPNFHQIILPIIGIGFCIPGIRMEWI